MNRLYITTALPYVNASPHVGFALEIIQADVLARHHRLLGEDVFFLTGSDENSLKNVQAAKEEEISTRELVDRNSQEFKNLKESLNLSFDDFIRTTEPRHIEGAQKLWQACQKDVYKKKYRGLYCVGCEEFYKEDELKDGLCPEHKTKPELVEEENYFFRLTKYQNKLKELIESDVLKIIPKTRKNEVLSFINLGLQDFCISRSAQRAEGWGIAVPGDPSQIIWVWFDALSNYINALGYGADDGKLFEKYWQGNKNILHIIGKGILRFHAVYWPVMLLSANLSLPKEIFVHGYLTINEQKISKSFGNVIEPKELVKKFGVDGARYLLLVSLAFGKDGDISWERLTEKYNADLANGLGNLLSRVIALVQKSNISAQGGYASGGKNQNGIPKFKKNEKSKIKGLDKLFQEFKLKEILDEIWECINWADKLVEEKKLWVLIKSNPKEAKKYLKELLSLISQIGEVLAPFMPETSEKFSQILKTGQGQVLFPRL